MWESVLVVDVTRPYRKLVSPVRLADWGFGRNGDPPRIVGEYSAYTDQAIDQGYRAVQELLIRADAEDLSGLPVVTKDCGNSVLDFASEPSQRTLIGFAAFRSRQHSRN